MSNSSIDLALKTAIAHHQAGQLPQAEALYRQILGQQPNNPDALHLLGVLAHQMGRNDIACELIRRAISFKPPWPEALSNLGVALSEMRNYDAAIDAFRQSLSLNSKDFEAYNNLGIALRQRGQTDQAIVAFRQSILLKPDYTVAHNNLGNALKGEGRIDEAIVSFQQAMILNPSDIAAHSNQILCMHYRPGVSSVAIAEETRRWNRQHAEPLKPLIQPHTNERDPQRRLRIGYVSPDFCAHPVAQFMLPLLENHHRESFEIIAFSQVRVLDAMTDKLHSLTDGWHNIVGLSDQQAADLVRAHQIDILVDLAVHTAGHRLLVFARKPAPVQVTWLGYPGSTGLDAIDYRLSDPNLDPLGMDDSIYSERTVRLPQSFWCYDPLEARNINVGSLPVIKAGFITFGSLNNFCKLSEPTISAWVRILQMVPGSQLLLHVQDSSARERIHRRFRSEGIASDCVLFSGRVPLLEYFQLYNQIDIALDTFPFAGGTTTCDALWMGVPVVSLSGTTAVGRGGFSILTNIGLPDFAADSIDDYVQIATKLANDLPRLEQLRRVLRLMMQQSPLMNGSDFAKNIEHAYRAMWKVWCESVETTKGVSIPTEPPS